VFGGWDSRFTTSKQMYMVYSSELLVNQIKEADSEQTLQSIIADSVSDFKGRSANGCIDKKYTRNILMTLKYYKGNEIEDRHIANIDLAIHIFKKLHAEGRENLL
jgi:hypothetical protein